MYDSYVLYPNKVLWTIAPRFRIYWLELKELFLNKYWRSIIHHHRYCSMKKVIYKYDHKMKKKINHLGILFSSWKQSICQISKVINYHKHLNQLNLSISQTFKTAQLNKLFSISSYVVKTTSEYKKSWRRRFNYTNNLIT